MRCISSHPLRYDYSGRSFAFTPENIAAAAIDRRDCSCCYAPQVRNEQMTPRGLRLGFCRGRKGYIGNIWLARHNRYQMLLQVRGRLWVKLRNTQHEQMSSGLSPAVSTGRRNTLS